MARPRPVDIGENLIALAVEAYRIGEPVDQVAGKLGVHRRTFQRWIAAGDAEIARRSEDPDTPTPTDPRLDQYVALAAAVKEADSRFVEENLLLIRRAASQGHVKRRTTTTKRNGDEVVEEVMGEPQWTAAAWLLERTHNSRFGRQIRQEISGPDGAPIQVDATQEAQISEKLQAYYQGIEDGKALAQTPEAADGA